MTAKCSCGRSMLARSGDLVPTCAECRSLPDACDCGALAEPKLYRVQHDPDRDGEFIAIEVPEAARDSLSPVVSPDDSPFDLRGWQSGDSGDSGDRHRTHWSARELMAADFPEPRWAVPGIIAEGVTLLAGPPKAGKSWLVLGLAVAAASGGKALGKIDVKGGPVLYLALEDTGRRLQSRLAKILGPDDAPECLTLVTACEPLPAGGGDKIAGWLAHHRDAQLVIIDVLARVRAPSSKDVPPYEADYRALAQAKTIADEFRVPFVVVHHTRKASAEDFIDMISGTQGLAGAADSILVLQRMRGQADAILHVTGRDVEEHSYALKFAADLGAWQMLDTPASEVTLTDSRSAILAYVRANEGVTPKQIAYGARLNYELAKKTCKRMAADGQLDTDGHGAYFVPVPVVPTDSGVPGVPGAGQDYYAAELGDSDQTDGA